MPAADLEEALKKKGGLSLAQLMIYDDIATDALVDRVYFWSTIRKARPNTRPSRGIRENEICEILQRTVIVEKDASTAQTMILKQHGIVAFMRTLGTADEKEHFERHMRKYINIWLPECPFEVCTTQRYTIVNAEACVIARKPIRAGDTIKYLTGIQVELTEEEEEGLSSRTDFSIVLSSRRKRPSLFLGPARFANHDCDSNARLTTTGAHGLSIVARRSIAVGEEITVTYGDDYFGEDNCECLCGTCERLVRNGWDPRGPVIHDDSSDDDDDNILGPRKRHRTNKSLDANGVQPLDLPHAHNMSRQREENGVSTPEVPVVRRKRGRPRKHPLPVEKPTVGQTMSARNVLSHWFQRKTGLGLYDDFIRVKSKSSRRISDDIYTAEDIPADKRHYERVNQMFEIMADRGASQLRAMNSKLSIINSMTATLLHTNADQVGRYYYPPGHKNHVPLPTPPPEEDELASLKVEPAEERDTQLSHFVMSPPQTSANGPVRTVAATASSSMSKQPASSPLRKVTLATQESDQRIPAVPIPDPPKRKRGRPRKYLLPEPVIQPVAAPVAAPVVVPVVTQSVTPIVLEDSTIVTREPTHASLTTDNSSTSSVFSREGQRGHISSNSSVSDTEMFSSGNNICHNIVEMFTSDSPAEDHAKSSGRKRGRPARRTRSIAQSDLDGTGRPSVDAASNDVQQQTVNSIEGNPDAERTEKSKKAAADGEEKEEKRGTPRIPGDYHMTEALLIDINDRWIECRNCDEFFVQHDAYLTRIACPRCERHSKLYGYYWPKTDKISRDDREERVLDHRLIHRFIEPEEERHERKGRKTLLDVIKDREMSSSQEVDSDERGRSRDDSRRRSRRVVYW